MVGLCALISFDFPRDVNFVIVIKQNMRLWCGHCLTSLNNKAWLGYTIRQLSLTSLCARDHVEGDQEATRWSPKKKLTRYQMDYLRTLRSESPELWTLRRLSKYFGISYISVVKILKSKFQPSEEVVERQDARASKLREQRKQILKEVIALQKAKEKGTRNSIIIKKNPPGYRDNRPRSR